MTDHLSHDQAFSELSSKSLETVAQTFKALSDPTRIRILYLLAHHECSVNEIADTLDLKQSTVSHQLRNLKSLNLVKKRREATSLYYSPDDQHVLDLLSKAIEHALHDW